jgi:hypothetical protein
MWDFVKGLFSSNTTSALESIATEWIETSQEKAEAQAVMVKALDPRGKMREQISRDLFVLYKLYLIISLFLLACQFFGYGDADNIADVTTKLVELFLPITGMVGLVTAASFGVNYANVQAGK